MPIYFYSNTDEYAYLSNFAAHGFELGGAYWPTVEHYFQGQKFVETDPAYAEKIRLAKSPKQAKTLGRSREHPLRTDWEEVKDEIMRQAVLKKFQTHTQLREKLLATGDEELIENAPTDYYWGCGKSGTGQNKLGQILMAVRRQLRGDEN
ncbi:MAG: NADAR family protein [Chloroflexi bacterium]|nr:NADAR family protein [Chloroflexota bacterium]